MQDFQLQDALTDDGTPIVRLSGELDLIVAQMVNHHVNEVVDSGKRHVVVDMAQVSFMDSTGIKALLAAQHHANGRGGDIRVTGAQPHVRRVFEITGIADRLLADSRKPNGS